MKRIILVVCLMALLVPAARAGDKDESTPAPRKEPPTVGHKALMYIPNRILDLLDIVRARLRLGPGLAVGVRATEPLSLYMGAYASAYAGLPGPRLDPKLPIPVGLEDLNGAQLSFLNLSTGFGGSPGYSWSEIGASLHVLLIGADVDVDPIEALDFVAGLLTLDPRGDDL